MLGVMVGGCDEMDLELGRASDTGDWNETWAIRLVSIGDE